MRRRAELRTFGELFALAGLAVAQPIFDIFGRAPEHFIFRGVDGIAIVVFALLVAVTVPLLAYALEVLVGLMSAEARRIVHRLLLGLLATAFLTLLLDGLLPRIPAILAGLVIASGFLAVYELTRGPRIWLAYLSPAPLVFLVLFLVASPVAPLIRGSADALEVPVGRPTPTIVVLFDEFPLVTLLDADGGIDADLFPNFARLAEGSHWFRQATTVSNTTTVAVPAMLTGNLPSSTDPPTSNSFPKNLFTLVGDAMPVTSSEVITRMCPTSLCEQIEVDTGGLRSLAGDTWDILFQRLSPTDPERDPMSRFVEAATDPGGLPEGAGELWSRAPDGGVERFHRFLADIDGEASLRFLHLLLPHGPYRLLPDGTGYPWLDPGLGRRFDTWTGDVEPVTVARQQFLLQLQWTDVLLGELLDRLEELGIWDEVNLIVVADHGYGFEPGETFRARKIVDGEDERTIAEILWVPFFVKTAGQTKGRVSDDPVRIVDLVPTVAEMLEVAIPWEVDGRSVFDGGSGDPDAVGLYRAIGGSLPGDEAHRSFDRTRLHDLLMERTTGAFAPAGPGVTGSDRIHRIGPRPDLFGRPVPEGLGELSVELHEDSLADDVDLVSGRVPALLQAVAPDTPPGQDVAIAVDGTIWATTTTYGSSPSSIAAILPARAFRDGANDITVHPLDRTTS